MARGADEAFTTLIEALEGDYTPVKLAAIINDHQRLKDLMNVIYYIPVRWIDKGDYDKEWLCWLILKAAEFRGMIPSE
ncbi:hypothetical protein ACFL6T_03000 [Candidatus Zixiibacteriota bacterium]